MYWEEEDNTEKSHVVTDDVVDLSFSIRCRTLPVDHAYALSQAIQQQLNWIADEPHAAIHTVHVAESGNGWFRPDGPGQLLYPSKRTKLTLRVPNHRIKDAVGLVGKTLEVDGHAITLTRMAQRPLSNITTLFARYIVLDEGINEAQFLAAALDVFKSMGVRPRKMLCGKETQISTPQGVLNPRSLMLADLKFEESLKLQQRGLGAYRTLGCGIFLPHKDINEIGETMG